MLSLDNLLYSKEINLLDFISSDRDVICSRNEVIEDLVRNIELYEIFKNLTSALQYIKNITNIKEISYASETHLFSLKQLGIYIECVNMVVAGKDSFMKATSHGITSFYHYVEEIAQSEEYLLLVKGTENIIGQISNIKSITVGFNFNEDLSIKEGGILSINSSPIISMSLVEKLLSLGSGDDKLNASIAPLTSMKIVNQHEQELINNHFYSALNKWFRKNISQWQPSVDAYLKNKCKVLLDLLPELIFLTESVRIHKEFRDMGLELCKPIIEEKEAKTFITQGLYNLILATKIGKEKIVQNDFRFDEKGMIYIFTGPNQGGKSVFTCAVGIAQIFAQLGWLVPAKYARISPVTGLFAHFPIAATQANTDSKGRLGEECERLAGIINNITEYSLILMDETLSSTDASEAIYIASDAIKAISTYGCRCIYCTHLHEIAGLTDEINSSDECISKVDYLKVCIDSGVRNYKISREKSDGKSYAYDIAKKYGLTYELMRNADLK